MRRLAPLLMTLAFVFPGCGPGDTERGGSGGESAERGFSDEELRELDRIATLGYISNGALSPDTSGVITLRPGADRGYTVCVSSEVAGAYVLDADGRVLHVWEDSTGTAWNRARPTPDGRVFAIQEFPGQILELDRDSHTILAAGSELDRFVAGASLLRSREGGLGSLVAHHDLALRPDGSLCSIMRTWGRMPSHRDKPFVKDVICWLVPEGDSARLADSLSVSGAFLRSEYADILSEALRAGKQDPMHTNSIEFLTGVIPHPAFAAGNILLSLRDLDCLAVIDPKLREVVWVSRGPWRRQHCARETPRGTIALFDNRPGEGQSRIVEYDPVGDRILWEYTAPSFFSELEGSVQPLPNGDLLVTESRKGRILELSDQGEVLWEYVTPDRADEGANVAVIYRAYRVPYGFFVGEFGDTLRARRLSGRSCAQRPGEA